MDTYKQKPGELYAVMGHCDFCMKVYPVHLMILGVCGRCAEDIATKEICDICGRTVYVLDRPEIQRAFSGICAGCL